ncbi:MAG: MFS transporter [Caloramator sp.]|nr:MFS transporter [Caloramator sp.]
MGSKVLKLKLKLLYFILYSSAACFYPFLTMYFQQRGIPYYKIGFLFAANSLIGIVAQPIWGIISDKYLGKRKIILINMFSSTFLILFFLITESFIAILFLLIIFMIFQSPILSVMDAYCYDIIEDNTNLQYGKIRLMGSMGYAVAALILGILIRKTSIYITFIAYSIFMIFSICILKSIKFKNKKNGGTINFHDISKLFKDRKFVLIVLAAMFASISMGANGNYIGILIQKTGGDISKLGLVWFVIAMSELPLFFVGNKIMKKTGVLNLYIIAMLFFSIRFFLNSICSSYNNVILIQLMQSITFTLYLLTTIEYININSAPNMKTSAFTAFSALAGGLGGFLGNIGGGFILQFKDIFFLYKILSLCCIVSLIIAFILKNCEKDVKNLQNDF